MPDQTMGQIGLQSRYSASYIDFPLLSVIALWDNNTSS